MACQYNDNVTSNQRLHVTERGKKVAQSLRVLLVSFLFLEVKIVRVVEILSPSHGEKALHNAEFKMMLLLNKAFNGKDNMYLETNLLFMITSEIYALQECCCWIDIGFDYQPVRTERSLQWEASCVTPLPQEINLSPNSTVF